jgi:hypothetical protein
MMLLAKAAGDLISRCKRDYDEEFIYTPPPRVGTSPNWSVQRGPIALPNLLCALSASHETSVRATGSLTL